MAPAGLDIVGPLLPALTNGFVFALVITLISLGLALILGLMGIVNIAHGDFYMLGAVLMWYVLFFVGNFWLAAISASFMVGVFAVGLERGILRRFVGKADLTAIATIGLTYIIEQTVLATYGGSFQVIPDPLATTLVFLEVRYPAYRLLAAGVTVVALVGLWLFLFKTSYGLWIRASMQDREMVNAMGVSADRVYSLTFALGSVLSALGGALAAPIVQVFYLMGWDILPIAFMVVIIGGLGSLKGTVLAAFLVSVVQNLMTLIVTPTEAEAFTFVLMASLLLIRPQGLFAR